MIMTSLRDLGVAFERAASGLEAIERPAVAPVHSWSSTSTCPTSTGSRCCVFVRSHERFGSLPVVIHTKADVMRSEAAPSPDELEVAHHASGERLSLL
jgi:hypothetical protein